MKVNIELTEEQEVRVSKILEDFAYDLIEGKIPIKVQKETLFNAIIALVLSMPEEEFEELLIG